MMMIISVEEAKNDDAKERNTMLYDVFLNKYNKSENWVFRENDYPIIFQ